MWKWVLLTVVVLGAVCGGGGYFVAASERGKEWIAALKPEEKVEEVRLAEVARGDLVRTVNAPGSVEPRTNVEISAQVSARIVALPFREGDAVKAGDVVVRLDARDLSAQLESAQANLKSEEAQLEWSRAGLVRATAEVKRQRDLHADKVTSRAQLEAAEAEFSQGESSLRRAEHAIEIARANIVRAEQDLENTTIQSPIDGTITRLDAEVGELVVVGTLNNAGSVIMEIADLSVMLLRARVDESNIAPVAAGQRAKIYINAYQDRTFEGVVERVELQRKLDKSGTGYFEVEVLMDLAPGETLYSGLTANTDVEVETLRDVIKVPSQAVLDRRVDELPEEVADGSQFLDKAKAFAQVVCTMVDGKAVAVPVSVGSSDLTHTVVVGGLAPGDRIITGPYKVLTALKHGQLVAEEGTLQKKDEKKAVASK